MGGVEIPEWLRSLPLAPEYRPTDTEFADPIAFISRIEQEASAFGICKVVPPLPKPSKRFVLSNLNRSLSESSHAVFTTRCQELGSRRGSPSVHKQVWQSGKSYSLEQFEAKSRAFARSHLGRCKDTRPVDVEALFWKAAAEKPICVEYANDVPGSGFHTPQELAGRRPRYACGHKPKIRLRAAARKDMEGTAGWKLSNSPWNLQVIARSPGSLTRFMPDEVPGVTSPMVYIGMLFSWFAWHVEDHELHSLNFLHTGASKSWYAVPGSYASVLEEVVRIEGYGSDVDRLDAFIMLGEKRTVISPEVLIASGIPCCRLVQNPGEFVVTFPRAYHVGFSHGFNCGEAANFATYRWLNVAKEAAVRRATMNYLPMLSHQQLLYLLAMSYISRIPTEFLPGAHCSRLRDRLKEERELVVKKSFLEDIMNELKLLNVLLGKKSTLNVVLWDTDMLPQPLSCSEPLPSLSCEQLPLDAGEHEDTGCQLVNQQESICFDANSFVVDELHEVENIIKDAGDKFYSDDSKKSEYSDVLKGICSGFLEGSIRSLDNVDSDLPCGLDVDPGALVCVGCGILGYPFMSVIQPCDDAMEACLNVDGKADGQKAEKLKLPPLSSSKRLMDNIVSEGCVDWIIEKKSNGTNTLNVKDWTQADAILSDPVASRHDSLRNWNLSDQRIKPHIFCLQHAIEVEEKLQRFGGARLLIICHSDYPKIKSQVTALKDMGNLFNFEGISVDYASKEDLDLINISIDNERCKNVEEDDWTSKMGMNLKHFIKRRKEPSEKQASFCLSLDGLLPRLTPQCGLALKWPARRSRTPCRFTAAPRYRFQPGSSRNSNETMANFPCNGLGDVQVAESCKEKILPGRSIQSGVSVDKSAELHKGNESAVDNLVAGDVERSLSGFVDQKYDSHIGGLTLEAKESCKLELPVQIVPLSENVSLLETNMLGLQPVFESTFEAFNKTLNIESKECLVDGQSKNPSGEAGISKQDSPPRSLSTGSFEVCPGHMDGACKFGNNIVAESWNFRLDGKSKSDTSIKCGYSVSREDGYEHREAQLKHHGMLHSEETVSKCILTEAEGRIYGSPSLIDHQAAIGSSCENPAMLQMSCSADIFQKVGTELLPTRSKVIACYHRKRKKYDNAVSSTLCSAQTDTLSPCNDDVSLIVQETLPCVKQRAKRKRECEYLSCTQYNFGTFIRSPCEGLRSRSRRSFEVTKNNGASSLGSNTNSLNRVVTRRKDGRGLYVCTLGYCRMKFDTKKKLALHKQNCCT